jgi:hypothetical protein
LRELYCYVVKRPDAPLDPSRLRHSRLEAWQLVLGELSGPELTRAANRLCSMDGLRLCCYRVSPSGLSDRFEP